MATVSSSRDEFARIFISPSWISWQEERYQAAGHTVVKMLERWCSNHLISWLVKPLGCRTVTMVSRWFYKCHFLLCAIMRVLEDFNTIRTCASLGRLETITGQYNLQDLWVRWDCCLRLWEISLGKWLPSWRPHHVLVQTVAEKRLTLRPYTRSKVIMHNPLMPDDRASSWTGNLADGAVDSERRCYPGCFWQMKSLIAM